MDDGRVALYHHAAECFTHGVCSGEVDGKDGGKEHDTLAIRKVGVGYACVGGWVGGDGRGSWWEFVQCACDRYHTGIVDQNVDLLAESLDYRLE